MELKDATNNKFKNGDIVFVNSAHAIAEKCKVVGLVKKESNTNKSVYILSSLDWFGTFNAIEDCIFDTKENAISAYEIVFKKEVELKPLMTVKFPIDNCLCGENTDYAAFEAYEVRTKEILNTTPKKGKWLIEDGGKNKYSFCYCSNCNSYYTIDKKDEMNFCPNCGSDMRESED